LTEPDRADSRTAAALEALLAVARRTDLARRLAGDVELRLLDAIVEATAVLFDAEAASIALYEPDPPRLQYVVAAGERGAGAIGLSVAPSQGIAGYVFSTGQPLALSDVARDPRFDRRTAERTGYVPRSIAAVPLVDAGVPVGVLQVLDKHTEATFSLRDMELLAVFARQAAAAIEASRVQRDGARLVRAVLAEVGDGAVDEPDLEALAGRLSRELDADGDSPLWRLVDEIARMRALTEREVALVADILAVVARRAAEPPGRRRE
jgi:GAF domain-containing protein